MFIQWIDMNYYCILFGRIESCRAYCVPMTYEEMFDFVAKVVLKN